MTRDVLVSDQIALLATGDELSNGDILNTNSQEIAQRLFNNGMHVGRHMVTGDRIADIRDAICYLLQSHRALIITGGLGPTSDDLTRYALADALEQELVFDIPTWDSIVQRLKNFGYASPPPNNRQQALFPSAATIIPNPNGTAAGCQVQQSEQFIFMLPGPPIECLPMVDQIVLPTLIKNHFQKILFHHKWLLFGVSEGQIAEELDLLAKPYDCMTGYRLWYPYIEFKLYSNNQMDFLSLLPQIEKTVAPYIIGDGKNSASVLLKNHLAAIDFTIAIADHATGGLLESIIKTPRTAAHLHFLNDLTQSLHSLNIAIDGLDEFWQNQNTALTSLELRFMTEQTQHHSHHDLPFRGLRVKQYAVELICRQLYTYLNLN